MPAQIDLDDIEAGIADLDRKLADYQKEMQKWEKAHTENTRKLQAQYEKDQQEFVESFKTTHSGLTKLIATLNADAATLSKVVKETWEEGLKRCENNVMLNLKGPRDDHLKGLAKFEQDLAKGSKILTELLKSSKAWQQADG